MIDKFWGMFTGEKGKGVDKPKFLIWDVVGEPYPTVILGDVGFLLPVKVEYDGVVSDTELYYSTHDDAMGVVRYFKSKIEPLEVNYYDQ